MLSKSKVVLVSLVALQGSLAACSAKKTVKEIGITAPPPPAGIYETTSSKEIVLGEQVDASGRLLPTAELEAPENFALRKRVSFTLAENTYVKVQQQMWSSYCYDGVSFVNGPAFTVFDASGKAMAKSEDILSSSYEAELAAGRYELDLLFHAPSECEVMSFSFSLEKGEKPSDLPVWLPIDPTDGASDDWTFVDDATDGDLPVDAGNDDGTVTPPLTGVVLTADAPAINVAIPDGFSSASVPLTLVGAGTVAEIGLFFEINHAFSADLEVTLQHPDGTIVMIRPEPETASNPPVILTATYGLGGIALASLDALKGKLAAGEWKVIVKDTFSSDSGRIVSLRLDAKLQ